MSIRNKIEEAVRERLGLGLLIPNFLCLNPDDMAEFTRELGACFSPSAAPMGGVSSYPQKLTYRPEHGPLLTVIIKPSGPMEFKHSVKPNGLQLLLRVKEKMKNE